MQTKSIKKARAGFTQIELLAKKSGTSRARNTSMAKIQSLGRFRRTGDTALKNGDFARLATYECANLNHIAVHVFYEARSSFGPAMLPQFLAPGQPINRLSELEKVVADLQGYAQCEFQLSSVHLAVDLPTGTITPAEFKRQVYVPWAGRHHDDNDDWLWGRRMGQINVLAAERAVHAEQWLRWQVQLGKLKLRSCKATLMPDLRSKQLLVAIKKHLQFVEYNVPAECPSDWQMDFQEESRKKGINDALHDLRHQPDKGIILRQHFQQTETGAVARKALQSLVARL